MIAVWNPPTAALTCVALLLLLYPLLSGLHGFNGFHPGSAPLPDDAPPLFLRSLLDSTPLARVAITVIAASALLLALVCLPLLLIYQSAAWILDRSKEICTGKPVSRRYFPL